MPDSLVYLRQAKDVIERHRNQIGKDTQLHSGLELELLEAQATEANILFVAGERDKASAMLQTLLVRKPPPSIPKSQLQMYLNPALSGWRTSLRARKHTFPSIHVLLQMKKTLLDIIREDRVCDNAELE